MSDEVKEDSADDDDDNTEHIEDNEVRNTLTQGRPDITPFTPWADMPYQSFNWPSLNIPVRAEGPTVNRVKTGSR